MRKRLAGAFGLVLALLAATARPAAAHDGVYHGANPWTQWSFEPLALLGVGLTGLVYARGWWILSRRGEARPARWRGWVSAAGLLIALLALVSPLDALADQLFAAHMAQHTLLTLVAPPLLALGQPAALLLGLPKSAQRGIGHTLRVLPGLRAIGRNATRPGVAWLLLAATLWGWHAPGLYSAALEHEMIHAAQHLSLIGTGLLFWWAALRTYGDAPERRGAAVLYLFTTALHSGLLGALITLSPTAWYPLYAGRSEAFGLSPLADQQLAGTIMWIPAGLVFLFAALAMLKSWMDAVPGSEGSAPQKEIE